MIICAGESLIDMLPRETGAGEKAFAPYAGGAVFNTSIALGRLGSDVGFVSGISNDLFGEILINALVESKVDTSFAVRSDRPTTLAFVLLVDGQATYAFYDEGTAGRMLNVDMFRKVPDFVNAMFFGGISLVSEPCAEAYEALMMQQAADVVTMIDPNIRPGFIKDEATYRARLDRMVAAADIVKLSDEDLHWLGGEGDRNTLVKSLLDKGPSLICITEGAAGATGYTRKAHAFAPAKKVEVKDTVGAGDTFNAGVLAGLDRQGALTKAAVADLDDATLEKALALGVAASAVTVSRAGANPPWSHEL